MGTIVNGAKSVHLKISLGLTKFTILKLSDKFWNIIELFFE